MGAELRDTEIDRRLRGRSEIEAELAGVEADTAKRLGALGLDDLAAAEDLLAREEAHVAQIDVLAAQLEGLVGKQPPEIARPDRATPPPWRSREKNSALEALGPIAKEPRARERLEVEVRDQETRARAAPATTRPTRGPGSRRTRVDAEEVAGHAESLARLARGARRAPAPPARLHHGARHDRKRRAGDDEVGDALPREADGPRPRRRRRPVATATSGSTTRRSTSRSARPEKRDWVKVTALSQGTLDLVYLTARLGLVRLVTGDRRPPLIFDDPFVTLDDARAARALDAPQGHHDRLPGHLPDLLRALRRCRRRGRRAARTDGGRRRRGPAVEGSGP